MLRTHHLINPVPICLQLRQLKYSSAVGACWWQCVLPVSASYHAADAGLHRASARVGFAPSQGQYVPGSSRASPGRYMLKYIKLAQGAGAPPAWLQAASFGRARKPVPLLMDLKAFLNIPCCLSCWQLAVANIDSMAKPRKAAALALVKATCHAGQHSYILVSLPYCRRLKQT